MRDRRGTSYDPLGVLMLIGAVSVMGSVVAAAQILILLGPLCFWGLLLWGVASLVSPRLAPRTRTAAVLFLVALAGLLVSYHRSQPQAAWVVDYLTLSRPGLF